LAKVAARFEVRAMGRRFAICSAIVRATAGRADPCYA
jgi:hypothetical protein